MSRKKKWLLGGGIALCICVIIVSLTCGLYFGLQPDEHVHGTEWTYVQKENNKHVKTCNLDGCEGETEDCVFVKSVLTAASCSVSGTAKYTCVCGNGYTETISAAGHAIVTHAATGATCTADGNILYYECTVCEKYFSDEGGTTEILDKTSVTLSAAGHAVVTHAATGATCTADGNTLYYECTVCHKYFSNENGTTEIIDKASVVLPAGHLGEMSYAYSASDKHIATCERPNCPGEEQACDYKTVTDNRPDCNTSGDVVQECKLCEHGRTVTLPAGTHSLNGVEESAATETAHGKAAHYKCFKCDSIFADSNGNTPVTEADLILHYYGWDDGTRATCSSTGTVGHYECPVCHKTFNAAHEEIDDLTEQINPAAHSFGQSYTIGTNGEKIFTCSYNNAHTDSVALSSIAIIEAPEYLVKDGASVSVAGFTVRAVYEDESNEMVTDSAALTNNASSATAHTASSVTFTYYGKTASQSLPVYEKAASAVENKTFGDYNTDSFILLAQTDSEFIYRFTLNVSAVGTSVWQSWVLRFVLMNGSDTEGLDAALRSDSWVNDNFGRGGSEAGSNGFTWTGADTNTKGEIDFTVTRVRASDHYRITVTMVKDGSTSVAVIDEPTTNTVNMRLYLGGEKCTFSYGDVIYYAPESEQNGVRVSAATVEVEYGTALNAVKGYLDVYRTYTIGGEERLSANDYDLICNGYNSQTAGNYTVTVSDGAFTTTFTVKVLAENAAPLIQRQAYFTPKTINNQGNFVSGSVQAGNGNIINNYWRPYTKPASIANPLKRVAASGYTVHADVNIDFIYESSAPLFSVRAAAGTNKGYLSVATDNSGQWQIVYDDLNGHNASAVIGSTSTGKLCLTISISESSVSVYVGDTRKLTLTDSAWQTVKDFVLSADLFYFYGGAKDSWTTVFNQVDFGNLGFYKGSMSEAQVKKLAADPATEDFTITVADTETDIEPLSVTYPSQTISSSKYVNLPDSADKNSSQWSYANTHDPSVFKDPNSNYYYVYSTDTNRGNTVTGGIHIRRSLDLITWEYVGTAFGKNYPAEAIAHVGKNTEDGKADGDYIFWAPDIIYLNGKYRLYYCMSKFGTATSYMGVATSASPTGPFTHLGEIYKSTGDDTSQPNAIDPNVFYDQEKNELWCFYGSWFGGIYAIQLDPSTGLPQNGQGKGTHIAGGGHIPMEGPYVVKEGGYYYLFVSYGDLTSDYNERVFRCPVSEGVKGNYVDSQGYNAKVGASGNAITTANYRLHGNKILGGYKIGDNMGYRAPGHVSILKDGDKYFMVAHTRTDKMASYNFFISVRQMFFTDDGWCVLNQNEYVGESLQAVNVANVAGTYDAVKTVTGTATEAYVNFENGTVANSNTADAHETLSKTLALNANGTVTGDHGTGTWEITDDYKITITLGSDVYNGFVIAAKDLQGNNVISFTTINQNGTYLFGNCIQP